MTIARRSRDGELEGRALLLLATSLGGQFTDLDVALDYARRAEALFRQRERPALRFARCWRNSSTLTATGRIDEAKPRQMRLALARQCGDNSRPGPGPERAHVPRTGPGQGLQRYQQALAAFSAGGVVSGRAAVIGNMGVTYLALGLFHRARRLLLESDRLQRSVVNKLGIVTNAWNLFGASS